MLVQEAGWPGMPAARSGVTSLAPRLSVLLEMLKRSAQNRKFKTVVTDEHYRALWRYACRLSRSHADAEDLCQETLARAYERIDQLREPGAAKTWLFRIMYSVSVNLNRRAQSRPVISLLADWIEPVDNSPRPDPLAEVVGTEITRLPDLQRQLIELFYFEEMSLDEIADVLDISSNTVKQRLFRARARLRSILSVCLMERDENAG